MSQRPDIDMSSKSLIEPIVQPPQKQDVVVVIDQLTFHKNISNAVKAEMKKRLFGLDLCVAQNLLDELTGRMAIQEIKNPLVYLVAMKRKFLEGEFSMELGIQIKENREVLANRLEIEKAKENNFQTECSQNKKSAPDPGFNALLKNMGIRKQ